MMPVFVNNKVHPQWHPLLYPHKRQKECESFQVIHLVLCWFEGQGQHCKLLFVCCILAKHFLPAFFTLVHCLWPLLQVSVLFARPAVDSGAEMDEDNIPIHVPLTLNISHFFCIYHFFSCSFFFGSPHMPLNLCWGVKSRCKSWFHPRKSSRCFAA